MQPGYATEARPQGGSVWTFGVLVTVLSVVTAAVVVSAVVVEVGSAAVMASAPPSLRKGTHPAVQAPVHRGMVIGSSVIGVVLINVVVSPPVTVTTVVTSVMAVTVTCGVLATMVEDRVRTHVGVVKLREVDAVVDDAATRVVIVEAMPVGDAAVTVVMIDPSLTMTVADPSSELLPVLVAVSHAVAIGTSVSTTKDNEDTVVKDDGKVIESPPVSVLKVMGSVAQVVISVSLAAAMQRSEPSPSSPSGSVSRFLAGSGQAFGEKKRSPLVTVVH